MHEITIKMKKTTKKKEKRKWGKEGGLGKILILNMKIDRLFDFLNIDFPPGDEYDDETKRV